ncbi:MAG: GDP-mannose 4,6-dehydratase [Betaproteobacteria bacterium]
MKRALICGVGGQDGSYLSRHLLSLGYNVVGTSRDAQISSFSNLEKLGIREQVQTVSMAPNDFRSVLHVVSRTEPDEIYYLAGQSSVGLSFEQPVEAMESISLGTLNILEAIRYLSKDIKFYNAGSSECFGDTKGAPADENTPFYPRSPYAVAKCTAHWQIANYREAYNLFACTGILFNHESSLRPSRFVTQKIVATALRIAAGSKEKLALGNTKIVRDWGWAPEYVEAMHLMLQHSQPNDYVIATGNSTSLEAFIELAFGRLKLDWRDHVEIRPELFRPSDLSQSRANPEKAASELGWRAAMSMKDVVRIMVDGEV